MYLDIRDYEKLKKTAFEAIRDCGGLSLTEVVEEVEDSELDVRFLETPSQANIVAGAGLTEAVTRVVYDLRYIEGRVVRFRDLYFAAEGAA